MMNDFLKEYAHVFKELQNALDAYGSIGFITELAKYNAEHAYLINYIQNVTNNKMRDTDEDPAEVLRRLRERYAPDTDELNDRAWFFHSFVELIETVDRVAGLFERAQR